MSDQRKLPGDRYNAYTSTNMVKIGGVLGVSPKKLQHLWEGYTGTMGAYALAATDMLTRSMQTDKAPRPAWSVNDLPAIKSFWKGSAPKRSTQYTTDLYDRLHEVSQIHATIKDRSQYNREAAMALRNENIEKLRYRTVLSGTSTAIRKLKKRRDAIVADKKMSKKAKKMLIDSINAKITKMARRTSKATESAF